jgi:hypothetical protein
MQKIMVLTGGLDASSPGVGVAATVEFLNSRHAVHPDSVDLLWQHVSTVQKPAMSGSYCLNGKVDIVIYLSQGYNEEMQIILTYMVLSDVPKRFTKGMNHLAVA